MTDALNPALPIGGNPVEIASELRGIKQRLVLDKAAIEELQVDAEPLNTRGAVGDDLLAAATTEDARTALDFGVFGSQLADLVDLAAAQALLGITSQAEQVTTATNKGKIVWAGGVKLQWTVDLIPSGGSSVPVTWMTPFSTVCIGAWTSYHNGGSEATCWVDTQPDLLGVEVDHNSGSSKTLITFAIGV
jgi:hypothetical protein